MDEPRFELRGKNVLLVSPDRWREMYVSKHHYAVELARRGNRVYFLNPPEKGSPFFRSRPLQGLNNVVVVDYNTTIRGRRFLPRRLLAFIELFQIGYFTRRLGVDWDVVWCFSNFSFHELRFLNAPVIIFHPVDKILSEVDRDIARASTVVLSVAENILEQFARYGKPMFLVNHGLAGDFAEISRQLLDGRRVWSPPAPGDIKVGYVGNLLRPDIDHETLTKLIEQNPQVSFVFWGPYKSEHVDYCARTLPEVGRFIEFLAHRSNVVLKGLMETKRLAREIHGVDGFLCCYDPKKEINECSNNHKIVEYLSTGKFIVSNYVPAYHGCEDLITMPEGHGNQALPALFRHAVENLSVVNSEVLRKRRIAYALANTYDKHIGRIEEILNNVLRGES